MTDLPIDLGAGDLRRALIAEDCRRSLLSFVGWFWETVEPRAPLVKGWWLDALCLHLEAVHRGELKRLLINVPPGFCKSLMLNVFFPAWEWGPCGRPDLRYVSASYSSMLTERDNQRMQQVVLSPLYRELWGSSFTATENRVKFANSGTGWKLATSVEGVGTGERGDRVLIDDPNNIRDVESAVVRESTNRWLTEVMPTRLNNPAESAIVLIQQRSHEDDATGRLLEIEDGGFVHLCLPMKYDPQRHCRTPIGWEDPRTEEGELMWPERFPAAVVKREESILGPYAVSGQFQQLPTPRGGGIIKMEWWKLWPPRDDGSGEGWARELTADGGVRLRAVFPEFIYTMLSVDTAMGTAQTNDWSACTVWGVWEDRGSVPRVMLIEAWRVRETLNGLVRRVMETARRRKAELVLVEEKANGSALGDEIKRLMRDGEFVLKLFNPGRQDKSARLQATEPLFAGGVVFAPGTAWARMVIDEVTAVPRGRHDDLADTVAMALIWLRRVGLARLAEELEEEDGGLVIGGRRDGIAEQYGLAG